MQNARGERPSYPIGSVDNALLLISLIVEREQIRVSEAAEALGTARSTAHRLLAMLEYHGFARQDEDTKSYVPGPALINLGLSAVGSLGLRRQARPVLERLTEQVGETSNLVRLQDSSLVFIDSVETKRALRVGARVGTFMPAHCTSGGKAILAQLSPDDLRRLYPGGRLVQMTPRSLSTFDRLEKELATVRTKGYATNFGESEADVAAVGVALPGGSTIDRAAITVAAPITRMDEQLMGQIVEAVMRAAAELGSSLADMPAA